MAVAYKSAGAGASTETSGAALSPACPATVDVGDILIAHVFWEGTTTAPSTPSGWTLLDGPEVIETSIARHWVFGKVADGTEDGAAVAFGSPAVTTQRAARIYSFSGRVSGDISLLCQGFSHQSHATDPQMPTVTTVRAGALAVALVAQNDNNATGNATGESGGDWTEAVAEYTVALTPGLTIQLQTCTPTSNPGTVSGGSVSTTNDPCGVIGFYIQDVAETPKSATDTAAVGLSDVHSATMVSLINQDTISGFDDDWRLLTDSDLFTYHNRIDSAQVRLNGADQGAVTVTPVSAADSLIVGLTDTFTGSLALSVNDSLGTIASDEFTGSQALTVIDSLAIIGDALASISSSVFTDETVTIQAIEASAILNAFSTTDEFVNGFSESDGLLSAVLTTADSCAAQVSGEASLSLVMSVLDSVTAGLVDDFTGSQAIQAEDDCSAGLTEDSTVAATISIGDDLAVQFTDFITQVSAVVTASDSSAVQGDEIANVIQNTLLSVVDTCTTQLDEAAQIAFQFTASESLVIVIEDNFTGSQALGVSDETGFQFSEDQSSSLLTEASDAVATTVAEATSVFLEQYGTDELAVVFSDLGSKQDIEAAIAKAANDSIAVQVEEGAVTELAGPYWSGTAGIEYATVHADSYGMGRRENPGRMRW